MPRNSIFFASMTIVVFTLVIVLFPLWNQSVTVAAFRSHDILTSVPVDEAPTLDGVADEAFWTDAPEVEVPVEDGANTDETTVVLRSVYTNNMVYFLVTWEDPTESYLRSPWEMQEDGTWVQLQDPEDEGGDNNLWYEDKLAFIWPINNSIPGFEEEGCGIACHRNVDIDTKPFGLKFLEEEGQIADMWHWKSVRDVNQLDDQYLDHQQYAEDNPNAGRHSDPNDGGGYADNISKDGTAPAFMPSGDFPRDGSPGYILESEAVPFDPEVFEPGDRIPSIVVAEFAGDRGDISAGWVWEDGVWTLEFGRTLTTGSEMDVQFDDLSATYFFGVATFDNAQVRHSTHDEPVRFVFGE